ncbi:hypothetical protein FNF27_08152 [Cafeteria roenbergensis]|uniref:Uncharacterized protein n=1 Tax=Cafeteria roenbergensis TaxID=33653 RepID=A0A5A8DAI0_CAFRO|nr:hypothetical protein FNF27_08152 [Cafeteria roenbergensis]
MAAVKGLRSADNEDIVKLLGRLGTASMELAHSTDINAVLQHAGVTLAMPGGEALLAKWHRLGHLQSVAGGFAEVMAKPSTIATVETHAKKLLLEAKREAKREAEEQAEKAKREAEEKAEKAKREAEEQELRLAPAHTLASLLDSCLLVINGRQGKALLDVLILRVQAALVSRLPPDSPVMAGLPPEVVRLSRRLKQQSVDNACKLAKETGAAVPQEDLTPAGLQTVADCLINTLKSCHDLSWLASQPALFDILHCTATACPPVFLAEGGPTAKVAENLRPDTLLSMGFANAFLGAAHGEERSTVILLRPYAGPEQAGGRLGDKHSTDNLELAEGPARDPHNVVWRAMLRLGYLDAHLGGKSGLEVAAHRIRTMGKAQTTAIELTSIGMLGDMLDGHERSPRISMTLCFDESQNYFFHSGVLSKFVNLVERFYTSNIPMRMVITGSSAVLPRLVSGMESDAVVTQQYNMHGAAMRDGLLSMPEFGDAVAPSFPFRPYRHGFNVSKLSVLDPVPYLEESEGLSFLRTSWRQHSAHLRRFMETLPASDDEAHAIVAPLVTATNGSPRALLQLRWGDVVQGGRARAAEAALSDQFRRFRQLFVTSERVPARRVLLKAVGLAALGKLKPEASDASTGLATAAGAHVGQSSSTVETSLEYVSLKSLLSAALSASQRLFGDDAAHTKELMKFESSFSSSSRSMQRLRADIEAAADFWHEVGFFRGRTLTSSFVMPGQAWRSFAVHLVLAGSSLTAVEMMALVSPASKILSDHFERLLAAELLHSGFQAFVSACMARFCARARVLQSADGAACRNSLDG